jgi:lysophospholipase L1-like esterase
MNRKSKKRVKFLLYNVVVVGVIFVCLEGCITLALNNPASSPDWLFKALKTYQRERDWNIIQMNPQCALYDSNLFYTLKPGAFQFVNREFSNEFRVNHLGFRDDEESLNAPKAIVLGDSYTMGWGVDQNETFTQILEEKLGYTVLNTGISSYGTAREVAALERINTDNLEYLIIQYCENDRSENQRFILNDKNLNVESQAKYDQLSKEQEDRLIYYPFKHIINLPSYFSPNIDKLVQVQTEETLELAGIHAEKSFIEILKNSKKIPAQTKIIIFCISAESCGDEFINQVERLLAKDFTSSMADRISFVSLDGLIDSSHRYVFDPHLNTEGHKIIASKVLEGLESLSNSPKQKTWYYESGNTSVIANYKNGLKHGQFTAFWPNGNKSLTSTFVNGEKQGVEFCFNDQGDTIDSKWYVKVDGSVE